MHLKGIFWRHWVHKADIFSGLSSLKHPFRCGLLHHCNPYSLMLTASSRPGSKKLRERVWNEKPTFMHTDNQLPTHITSWNGLPLSLRSRSFMILIPGDLPEVDTGSSGKVSSSSAIQEKFQYLGAAVGFPEFVDEGRSANQSKVCRQGPSQIYCSAITMTEEALCDRGIIYSVEHFRLSLGLTFLQGQFSLKPPTYKIKSLKEQFCLLVCLFKSSFITHLQRYCWHRSFFMEHCLSKLIWGSRTTACFFRFYSIHINTNAYFTFSI